MENTKKKNPINSNNQDFIEKLYTLLEHRHVFEISNLDLSIDQFELMLKPIMKQTAEKASFRWVESILPKINPNIKSAQFSPIEEITFKRSNGNEVKIGGDIVPPYLGFFTKDGRPLANPHPPTVTFDVFDMKIKLPKIIKNEYRDVLDNPVAWAQLAVKRGAKIITLHFTSTDPGMKDTPISKAVSVLEDVLQAVPVPIIIGGSGNKKKDTELFKACAAATQGERLMLSSADKLTIQDVVPIARKYGHNVLLWAQLDINDQTKLVEDALSMGMPRDRIVLDPTCATLGYGLEYSFSIYQNIRLAGLEGDKIMNFPLSAGTTNAWGGREAWMKKLNHVPAGGGDRAYRGPLWEIITALSLSLCGLNLAMMFHPTSAQIFQEMVNKLYIPQEKANDVYKNFIEGTAESMNSIQDSIQSLNDGSRSSKLKKYNYLDWLSTNF